MKGPQLGTNSRPEYLCTLMNTCALIQYYYNSVIITMHMIFVLAAASGVLVLRYEINGPEPGPKLIDSESINK